jgi:hypothetical protein
MLFIECHEVSDIERPELVRSEIKFTSRTFATDNDARLIEVKPVATIFFAIRTIYRIKAVRFSGRIIKSFPILKS